MRALVLCLVLFASGCSPEDPAHASISDGTPRHGAFSTSVASKPNTPDWAPEHFQVVNSTPLDPSTSGTRVKPLVAPIRPASPLPYARPDLSNDADERERAKLMRTAIMRDDFKAAQSLASTQTLQELFIQEQRAHAEAVQEEQITASADMETGDSSEEP